ncbi:MAG TPA: hypothetical protein GX707_01335 [Epulopiscium sp.]|nr:hypothetical protein [Candidatus Epulonipiscium sp.]
MAMITIDGVDLPSPSEYGTPGADLHSDDTGRNELGFMLIDMIRGDVTTIPLKYNGIRSPEVALIKSAISPPQFNATIVTETGKVTKRMYVGNRDQKMVKYSENVDEIRWDLSFNLIEI